MSDGRFNGYNSAAYKRSRYAYIAQSTFEYFIASLVADAFLAKLLTSIGISDSLIGIISSLISMAIFAQLMSIFLVKLKVSSKTLVITCEAVCNFFFILLYLTPFLPCDKSIKTILIVLSIIIAYAAKYMVFAIYFKWANSFVDPTERGRFSATKDIIVLTTGILFTMSIGYVIDIYEGVGNLNGGFLFIASAIFILSICDFVCRMMIQKEDSWEDAENSKSLKEVIANTLGRKECRNVIIHDILRRVGLYFTAGYIGIFKIKELGISVFWVQVINVIGIFSRFLVTKPFGKYSDKYSFAKGMRLGLYLTAAAFFINIFTNDNTWFLIVIFTVLYNCGGAGTDKNSYNMLYNYVDYSYFTQAMALKNSLSGVSSFAASLLAGLILELVQKNGNRLLGIPVYGQQLLAAISFVITMVTALFTKNVIEKQQKIAQ